MSVTTTSIEAHPVAKCRELIAASSNFRDAAGAADATAALGFIHILEGVDEDGAIPRCIIWTGDEFTHNRLCPGEYENGGTLRVLFQFPPLDPALSNSDNDLAFLQQLGAIISDCDALAGQGSPGDGESYLNAEMWSRASTPERCRIQEEGGEVYYEAQYLVRWRG